MYVMVSQPILESRIAAKISWVVAFVLIPGTSNGKLADFFFEVNEKAAPSLLRISTSSFCANFKILAKF